jgi:autotransporter-associated beta strand protein
MKSHHNRFLPLALIGSALALVTSAHAENYTWGGGNGNWTDTNWTPGPVAGSVVVGSANTATISGGVTVDVNWKFSSGTGGNLAAITVSGATLNLYNNNGGDYFSTFGNLFLAGGTITGSYNSGYFGGANLRKVTVTGTSASTIASGSDPNGYFNLRDISTGVSPFFDVQDAAGNLNVTARLADTAATLTTWAPTGLIKNGAGTVTLSAVNDYTGTTIINAGTFAVNGSITSAVTVGGATASGSPTLSGTGTVSAPLIVAAAGLGAAGTVNPGTAGTTGTLSAGATTIAGTYACDVISAAADTLAVTGNLDLTGAKFTLTSVTPTPGTYTIATYTGNLFGTFTPTPALPAGTTLDYATTGEIKLVIAATAGYASWASTNSVLEGENGDDDDDGVSNLVEYALGLDPQVGNPAPGTFTGNTLTFTKGTEAKAAQDVTYKIQTSTTLAIGSWTDAAATNTTNDISFLLPANEPGGKLFGRLQVTKP